MKSKKIKDIALVAFCTASLALSALVVSPLLPRVAKAFASDAAPALEVDNTTLTLTLVCAQRIAERHSVTLERGGSYCVGLKRYALEAVALGNEQIDSSFAGITRTKKRGKLAPSPARASP